MERVFSVFESLGTRVAIWHYDLPVRVNHQALYNQEDRSTLIYCGTSNTGLYLLNAKHMQDAARPQIRHSQDFIIRFNNPPHIHQEGYRYPNLNYNPSASHYYYHGHKHSTKPVIPLAFQTHCREIIPLTLKITRRLRPFSGLLRAPSQR